MSKCPAQQKSYRCGEAARSGRGEMLTGEMGQSRSSASWGRGDRRGLRRARRGPGCARCHWRCRARD